MTTVTVAVTVSTHDCHLKNSVKSTLSAFRWQKWQKFQLRLYFLLHSIFISLFSFSAEKLKKLSLLSLLLWIRWYIRASAVTVNCDYCHFSVTTVTLCKIIGAVISVNFLILFFCIYGDCEIFVKCSFLCCCSICVVWGSGFWA